MNVKLVTPPLSMHRQIAGLLDADKDDAAEDKTEDEFGVEFEIELLLSQNLLHAIGECPYTILGILMNPVFFA